MRAVSLSPSDRGKGGPNTIAPDTQAVDLQEVMSHTQPAPGTTDVDTPANGTSHLHTQNRSLWKVSARLISRGTGPRPSAEPDAKTQGWKEASFLSPSVVDTAPYCLPNDQALVLL